MTLKNPQTCLSAELLRQLSHDELSPAELKDVEDHVSDCERCRQLLEVPQSDPQWQDEIVPILRTPLESPQVAGDHDERGTEGESLESILRLLGPTDDPHMLGRIGSYEVVGVIGRGGMGVVFKAYEGALNRFVAIKMLLPHLAASGAARKRFAREGQAAAAVIDDNVMPIYSVAEWQGVPYLVTQYSRGATLQKRIQDQGPLELKEILRIGMQTARGLAAAHAQGLVHRDVKPSNILLDGTVERALLTDFGLARAVDDASITRTGIIAGTPQYMSPEQARGGSVDARSDLFGLGCVLYAMCTGRPPFRADNSYAILRMITDDEPRSIREINADIPEWLCLLISRLMAKSPDARFGNALEVAALLEQCLAHVQQPTSVPLPASLVPHATGRRSIFNVTRKGVLAMLGTIGMTLLGLVLFQATEAPDISGQWTSDEWGTVVLEAKGPGKYEGTFSGADKGQRAKGSSGSAGRDSSSTIPAGAGGAMPGSTGLNPGFGPNKGQPAGSDGSAGSGFGDTIPPGAGGAMPGSTGLNPGFGPNKRQPAGSEGSADSGFDDTILPGGGGVMPGSSGTIAGKGKSGTLQLKWSRVERRFNGTWRTGEDRNGKMSLRLLDNEIRGAWTTAKDAQKESGTPRLGDLLWTRSVATVTVPGGGTHTADKYVPQPIDTEIRKNPDGKVSFNIKKQPWERVLKWLADASALSVDWQELPGDSLDLITTRDCTMEEARDLINLHLVRRGYTMVVNDEVISIIKVKELNPATVADLLLGRQKDETQSLRLYAIQDLPLWSKDGTSQHIDLLIHYLEARVDSRKNGGDKIGSYDAGRGVLVVRGDARKHQQIAQLLTELRASSGQPADHLAKGQSLKTYSIADLPIWSKDGKKQSVDLLLSYLRSNVDPPSWESKATRAAYNAETLSLVVQGTEEVHSRIKVALSRLPNTAAATPTRVNDFTTARSMQIACSADGKLIAVAHGGQQVPGVKGLKRSVEILQAETGKSVVVISLTTKDEEAILDATEEEMLYLEEEGSHTFSPDGTLLAMATGFGQVKLFKPLTGELVLALDDEREKLAEQKTPEKLKTLKRAMGSIRSLAFSPDGTRLAMCGSSFDDAARNWDGVRRLGELVTGPGRLKVWDVKTGALIHNLAGHSHADAVSFSADGNLLASAGRWNGDVSGSGAVIWDAQTGKQLRTIANESNGGTHAVVFSPTGNVVAIGSRQFDKANNTSTTTVSLTNAISGITEWQQTMPGWAKPGGFSPDGKSLVVLCGGEAIRFFDTETGAVKREIRSADSLLRGRWYDFALPPHGRRMAIGGVVSQQKGTVEIWDFLDHSSASKTPMARYSGSIVWHLDSYGSGTGGRQLLANVGQMGAGFDYGDPSKTDWKASIKWSFLRSEGKSGVYQVEWEYKPEGGSPTRKVEELSFDGVTSAKLVVNKQLVISIEPDQPQSSRRSP